jgi:protein phosphatase
VSIRFSTVYPNYQTSLLHKPYNTFHLHRNGSNVRTFASQSKVELNVTRLPFKELNLHEFGAGTHVGNLRDNNEDSYVCDPNNELWIVADGMGGLGLGEVASAISTYTVAQQVKSGHGVNQAIEIAHKKIKEYALTEARGTNMGTTMVLLLTHGSLYNVFWVGDSRAYLFDSGNLRQLTTDHSLVQSLIDRGEITPEEAISDPRKNVVTRALGVQEMEAVRADSLSEKWQLGQKILLCSDGLTDCVRQENIEAILSKPGSDQDKVDELIQAALDGGGNDNITVVLVSASVHASKAESDTHVPGESNDSTHVPHDGQTLRGRHFSAEVETTAAPVANEEASPGRDTSTFSFASAKTWLAATAILVLMVVFSRLTTAERGDSAPLTPNQLLPLDTEVSMPAARPGMPDIDIPKGGSVIQLGLFRRLEGAELRQQELARQGYVPFVEKKVSGDEVQFAVLLGPYYNPAQAQKVSDALNEKNINHFERSESQY